MEDGQTFKIFWIKRVAKGKAFNTHDFSGGVGHKARLIANMPRARQNNLDLNNHCKLDSLVFVQLFMILMKNKEDQTKQNTLRKQIYQNF